MSVAIMDAVEAEAPIIKAPMALTVGRDVLHNALQSLKRIPDRHPAIPALSHVLMTARAGRLWLRTTDLDRDETIVLPADVKSGGAVAVPVFLLADIVKSAPKGAMIGFREGEPREVREWVSDKTSPDSGYIAISYHPRVVVTTGRGEAALYGLISRRAQSRASDFPKWPAMRRRHTHRFSMPAAELRALFEAVEFAISTEETRYYLNGVFLTNVVNFDGSAVLRAVTTGGHRLARVDTANFEGDGDLRTLSGGGVIIPAATVSEVIRITGKSKDIVHVALSGKAIEFRLGAVKLRSAVIDGTFPDYTRVIPTYDKVVKVDTAAFVDALKRVSTMSSERGKAVKLTLEHDRLTFSVKNPDSGETRERIDAIYEGPAGFDIGFNANYLIAAAEHAGADHLGMVTIKLSDAGMPVIISGGNDRALFVQMPCRV